MLTKCPACRQESMFAARAVDLAHSLKMHRHCPHCGQDFIPEPGFYFGAMYFSYAINVALMVTFGVGVEVLFSPERIWITLASIFVPTLLLSPWNFRISRAIMLYTMGGVKRR